ncbi:hypothetical protein NZK32_08950 [Cyanobium sp. FGCU-52]|nr:hypothetical protein [Cyanobium sp. FGCU52]
MAVSTARAGVGQRAGLLALLMALPLAGCRPAPGPDGAGADANLRGSIVMAVGVNNDVTIDAALLEELNRRVGDLIHSYRNLHPRVRVEVQPFQEDRLAREMERRSRDGLAPDLLMVNTSTALTLAQMGVVRPIRLSAEMTDQLDRGSLERVRLPDGQLIGLPLLIQPQVACYDRRRVPVPPATLEALLARDGGRMQVGLPIDAINLAWTLGPLGALDTVKRLSAGEPETSADRARLRAWLEWLGNAHLQQGIHFLSNQEDLLKGLVSGRLDWISCRSTHLGRLRLRLGRHLGVALLPSGPGGPASPINRERLLAFGINSTTSQAQVAESLARFSINPLVQRTITLRSLDSLPVNRNLRPPVGSSHVLDTLVAARAQGDATQDSLPLRHTDAYASDRFRGLLTRYLYGEMDAREAAETLARSLGRRGGR